MTKINYILVLLIIFFLSSCGESKDGSKDNHGYGWAYDISYNGLLLRGKWQLEPEEIYEIYTKAINCIGYAEPPFIIFKSGSTNGINSCGVYYKDPALIVINKDCRSYQEKYIDSHEMVHHFGLAEHTRKFNEAFVCLLPY